MAIKVELVKQMIDATCEAVTQSEDTWRDFLKCCAYMYKYDFGNQLAIYAQKPGAMACAGYHTWTKLGRYVKRNSKGIRLVNRSDYADKGYVFDVSDTARLDGNDKFLLWQADRNTIGLYLKESNNQFEEPFAGLLQRIEQESTVHFAEYASMLLTQPQEKDVQEIMGKIDRLAVLASMSSKYVILCRCGVNINDLQFDFSALPELDEMKDFRAFGEVLYDTQKGILRKLELTAKKALANYGNILYDENTKETNVRAVVQGRKQEGRKQDGIDIQTERGLPDPEPGTAASAKGRSRQMGSDERPLLGGTQTFPVVGDEHRGDAEAAPAGHRSGSGGNDRNNDAAPDGEVRRDGGTESKRPDGMGTQGQPDPANHSRADSNRFGVRLESDYQEEQLSLNLFPTVNEQKESIIQMEKDGDIKGHVPSFLMPSQDVIDAALVSLPTDGSRRMLCADYEKQLPAEHFVQRMRNEWSGGSGIIVGGEKYAVWADDAGIAIARGREVRFKDKAVKRISWDAAADRVRELLDEGLYLEDTHEQILDYDLGQMAASLWYMQHDIDDKAVSRGYIKALLAACQSRAYPEDTQKLRELLQEPAQLEAFINEIRNFAGAYREDPTLMRFSTYRPTVILPQLEALARERRPYRYQGGDIPCAEGLYISDDEIDAELMQGGNIAGSFIKIKDFFDAPHSLKEKAGFLKDTFGIGGKGGPDQIDEWHDAKGIRLQKRGCDEVKLTWTQAARRMDTLFNKLLDEESLDEMHELAAVDGLDADSESSLETVETSPLMDAAFTLYQEFASIAAEILHGETQSVTLRAGSHDMDLVIERLDGIHVSMTHYFEQNGDLVSDPDIEFVINQEKQTLMPVAYTNDPQGKVLEVMDDYGDVDPQVLEELNNYCLQWFKDLRYKGYTDVKLRPQLDADPEIKLEDGHAINYDTGTIDQSYDYQLLARLQGDCDYYLGAGGRHPKHLWAGSEAEQIRKMREIYGRLAVKPAWITKDDIDLYEREMLPERLAEIEKLSDEVLDQNPTSVMIDGRWRTFENAEAANAALDQLKNQTENAKNEAQNELLSEEKAGLHIPGSAQKKQAENANFYITDDALGEGTISEKYKANIRAIRTLKAIETEGRRATPEERDILSHYVGWGGLAKVFEEKRIQNQEIKSVLTKEEYRSARDSVLNAHYTPPVVMDAMYRVLSNIRFSGGSVLEPACGVGNFFGRMPAAMREQSKLYGVELDDLSGRMARAIYPDAQISIKGFEETTFADNAFDVAIGNVPFGDYAISDRYGKGFLIHDYFFAAALDKVRPGGVVAFITSSGTLDKKSSHVREHLARRADLIGAVRLPDAAFKAAGTETTTDILFLQKLPEPREDLADIGWLHLATDQEGLTYNQYFAAHPEMVAGEMRKVSGPYGDKTVCKLDDMGTFRERLFETVNHIQGSILPPPQTVELPEYDETAEKEIILGRDVPAYSFGIDIQGNLVYLAGEKVELVTAKDSEKERIRGMMEIRNITRRLINAQVGDAAEEEIINLRTRLNHAYDRYTARYGLLHSRENRRAFERDMSYPLLCSLEVVDEDGKLVRKADMFVKRTIRKAKPVTSVATPSEALAVSLAEKGCVDLAYMAKLAGTDEREVIHGLRGQIYPVPGENRYVTADEYLSGNIRAKLAVAKAYPGYEENVKALEAVLPEPLGPGEIDVRLGSTWVPVEIYKQFIFQLLQTPIYERTFGRINLTYSGSLDLWHIEGKGLGSNVLTRTTYGTGRASAYRIIENTMNLRPMQITDEVEDENGNKRRVVNAKETALACEKQDLIKEKFQSWIWADPQRREQLCKIYNEKFNSIRPREYDGSHLVFPGMNPEIDLRPHQRRAVARQIYGGNTLLAHAVGAGKTYEIAAAIMERKRLGLTSKAMIVVPNHLIGQWASEFLALYPAARILAVTKKDFEKTKRREFCARIAASDVDAVIIAHSQFEMIPLSKERQVRFLRQQLDQIQAEIKESAKEDDRSFTVKQLVSMEKKLTKKLKEAMDASRRDDVIDFEALGIDYLAVDEAHGYKNLALQTKMRNVAGVSTGGANKSFDMYAKCRYMDEITGGKGITFATGTPVSNSIAELYTMQRYLQYDTLESMGMVTFDRWASTFAESTTAFELAPEGNDYRAKTRFAKFFNLPELMSSFKECADILSADQLELDVPKATYTNVVLKPSERQKAMIRAIGERADVVRNGGVDARDDNMLKITTDGRKLALDERLLPSGPDDETQLDMELHQSKVDACAEKCAEIYRQTMQQKSTQLVFCDQSTPKADGSFNVYDDLKAKLIASGVKETEIAYIHDANTDAKKQELFARVRKGNVRILIGSTAKMGAGMNVQNKLIALHHLDVPWKPSDISQQEGRILRQGNENKEVQIYRYITENTFDAYSWQLIENKQRFISQIMTSKAPLRSCEDIDDAVLSAAEVKAQATGDPLIKERIELENDVARLRLSLGNYNNEHYQMQDQLERILPGQIAELDERITAVRKDIAHLSTHALPEGETFEIAVAGKSFTERAAAGEEFMRAAVRNQKEERFVEIAEYAGFKISSRPHRFGTGFDLKIQKESSMIIESGDSPFGVITRIKNAIQKLPENLVHMEDKKASLEADMERIKVQLEVPYEKAGELEEKERRLKELKRKLEGRSGKEEKSKTIAGENNALRR